MATPPDDNEQDWAPEPDFPVDPEFFRRVLRHLPTPLFVVGNDGKSLYCNQALLDLGGWNHFNETLDVFAHVHPEDREEMAKAFEEISSNPVARVLGGKPWAEIYFRIIAADGTTLDVELVGSGGTLDPHVGGIIYEMRPAQWRNLMGRVLDGLSQGASMHQLLSLIARMVAMPPLDLEAAVLRSTPSGTWIVAASTSPLLTETLRGDAEGLPWYKAARDPAFVNVNDLPERIREPLRQAGFLDLWHIAVESALTADTLRIVAVSPTHHVPASGPENRLLRTRELAAAVLLRTEADVLLRHAAAYDRLTGLPNRAAFYQQAEAFDPLVDRVAIHLDLDGLQRVNIDHGQPAGDALLQIVADRIRVACDPADLVGRVGDDDFAILLSEPGSTDLISRGTELAAKVLETIQDTIIVAGRTIQMGCSVGVAMAGTGIGTDHLLTWADAALHDAKHNGGGRVCRYGVGFG